MNDAMKSAIDGFATGRLLNEAKPFQFNSAGPQPGQYDPTPRYPDGTPVKQGFSTGAKRGRPGGNIGIGLQATTKAEIIKRYKAGEGLNPIAAAFSTSSQRVREILIQAGVTIRASGSQKSEQRSSDDMPKVIDTQPEQIRQIHERYMAGERLADCVAGQGLSAGTAVSRFKGMGLEYPRPKVAVTGLPPRFTRDKAAPLAVATGTDTDATMSPIETASEPEPQMDDPEPYAAAPDTRVIQVHDLTVTRRPYSPPCVLHDGPIGELVRPHNVVAIAHMVKDLVDGLNAIPGVTADFGFTFSMTAGAR